MHGCLINVVHKLPERQVHVCEIKMDKTKLPATKIEIDKLLAKNAIVESSGEDYDFVNNVFLYNKNDGVFHMILNLKQFNNFAVKKKFKMETLQSILHLVTPNCWMTISDLLDTYLSVPVLPALSIFLKFVFQGKIYMFKVLPFGYTGAPHIFTKLLKPLTAHLYKAGITVTFIWMTPGNQLSLTMKVFIHAPRPSNCSCPVVSCQI